MLSEQTWSTSEAPSIQALSYWRDIVCKNLLELQIESTNRAFFGHISQTSMGPMKANFISVSEQRVWRTRQVCHKNKEGRFHLIQVRKGMQLTTLKDRQLKLETGDCVLVDCWSKFEMSFPLGVEALVLEIRRDWLIGWLPLPEDAVGQVFGQDGGWGGTLSSALTNLTPATIAAAGVPHHTIAEQIAGLLAIAVGPTPDGMSTHKRALLQQVKGIIRERCHEVELDPTAVASTLRLSRRYIHLLFASAGTTFTQELYRCRLLRAERALKDPKFNGVGVAEIAWNCGFSGPSHFTRRFRDVYGVAPSAYRFAQAAQAGRGATRRGH